MDSRPLPDPKPGRMRSVALRASPLRLVPPRAEQVPALLACLPVLAGTQLHLRLLLQSDVFDLAAAADAIGRDPCAALRLFALVAGEVPDVTHRPQRMEDCIAGVSRAALWRALAHPPSEREEQRRAIPFAGQAFTLAHYARTVAVSLGLSGDQAFLLGLLHAIGSLPSVLGRMPSVPDTAASAQIASAMVAAYHVPPGLCRALVAVHRQEPGSIWVAVLAAAHDLAAKAGLPVQPAPFPRIPGNGTATKEGAHPTKELGRTR